MASPAVTARPGAVHDVVVLGSGAAGLTAALAAAAGGVDVGLYEKADLVGGTTAISGGVVWVPGNHLMDEAGGGIGAAASDADRAEALRYLRALAGDALDEPVAEALLAAGPDMLRFVEASSPCRFRLLAGYPDYHPEVPGARPTGGRSLEPDLFDLSVLGEWAGRLCFWDGSPRPLLLSETSFGGATAPLPAAVIAERRERGVCGMGEALVGSLLAGCLDAGVQVHTSARARRLMLAGADGTPIATTGGGSGAAIAAASPGPASASTADPLDAPRTGRSGETLRVVGVEIETAADLVAVGARRGVILATGGFEWNPALVRAFLRGTMEAPAGVPTNTGDGLDMAIAAGAVLGNMAQAWWAPMARVPGEEAWGAPRHRLVLAERTRPGSIMVNGAGERFCNEAANYNSLGDAFHRLEPATSSPAAPGSAPPRYDNAVSVIVCGTEEEATADPAAPGSATPSHHNAVSVIVCGTEDDEATLAPAAPGSATPSPAAPGPAPSSPATLRPATPGPANLRPANAAAWLVCDDRHRRRYGLPGCRRGADPPAWVQRGDTPAELAAAIGVPPAALEETVVRFNQGAARGVDPAFGRGASVYDLFNGDRTLPGAAATLGPLDEPPFWAVAIRIGALGTSGGPRTDAAGRVLARNGGTIPGLWAAGNAMAAPTATVYGGAGGTLGPAMTFGYLAGRDAAGHDHAGLDAADRGAAGEGAAAG